MTKSAPVGRIGCLGQISLAIAFVALVAAVAGMLWAVLR